LAPSVAETLSIEMDSLQAACTLISFAALSIDDDTKRFLKHAILGAGGTARVFRGRLAELWMIIYFCVGFF
jgi:hypothetical protein